MALMEVGGVASSVAVLSVGGRSVESLYEESMAGLNECPERVVIDWAGSVVRLSSEDPTAATKCEGARLCGEERRFGVKYFLSAEV